MRPDYLTLSEMLERVELLVPLPPTLQGARGLGAWWLEYLNLHPAGSGRWRRYTPHHVRLIAAWLIIGQLCGHEDQTQPHYDAADLMAAHEDGWVVMTQGRAFWAAQPSTRIFARGAVAIPVPRWELAAA